ncbi:MAG TPA: DUF5689 domain-containing protein, partial [Flavobacteriales bacterium]|nr:DUF5689 domain-containing protein [Flavobacteriales bacterium]
MNFRHLLLLTTIATFAWSCDKDLDTPPERTLPTGSVITIAELKAMYTNTPIHFDTAVSVFATVTSDENDGNFYKNISVQDHTGGITLRLVNSGGIYIGDSVRIYLPGTVLSPYNGLMQLDSVNVDNNIVKQATLRHVEPIVRTIAQLTPAALDTLQSMLIQLNDVEFTVADAAGGTWADAANQATGEHYLEDCSLSGTVMVRTSGYANYASQALPAGKGSIQCIAGIFGSTIQLSNRRMSDVHMNGARCPGQELPFFYKSFDDSDVSSGGWTQWSDNNVLWSINTIGGISGAYGQIKNFINFVNVPCETWLMSPSINLVGATSPHLSFDTGCNYTGAVLTAWVSTDYVSGAPSTATWTSLPATFSPGTWTWTSSGSLDLSPYQTSNVHIAFKYT